MTGSWHTIKPGEPRPEGGTFKGMLNALPISIVIWGALVTLSGWPLLVAVFCGVVLALCFAGAMATWRRG